MDIKYKKQAKKYIESCDKATKKRIRSAIEALPGGDMLTVYNVIIHFIPETDPEPDEIDAINAAREDCDPLTLHDQINGD